MRSKSASCCLPFERLGRQGSLALHRPRNANCSQAPREPMSLNSLVQKILPVPRRRQAPPPQDLPETPHHRPRRTFDPQRLLRHRFRGELPYCRHQTCCRPTSPYRPPRARRARRLDVGDIGVELIAQSRNGGHEAGGKGHGEHGGTRLRPISFAQSGLGVLRAFGDRAIDHGATSWDVVRFLLHFPK